MFRVSVRRETSQPLPTMDSVAIILINRDRPDLTDRVAEQVRSMGAGLEVQLFVVECGSRPEGRSRYATHHFRDRDYRGRYYGFNQGLKFAHRVRPQWDYYWFLVNDIHFPEGQDTLRLLWESMQEAPRMAVIGPGEPEAEDYRGCRPVEGRRWQKAATVHGLAWLMRGEALREVGYCSPRFRYSQGASTELAYLLYRAGWFLAYAGDAVLYHDQSGSTYGVVTKISRHEYHRRARAFASRYLRRKYGRDWDARFATALPPDVAENTFPWQRAVWEKELPRNWKEFCPWFWAAGSWVKQRLRALRRLLTRRGES